MAAALAAVGAQAATLGKVQAAMPAGEMPARVEVAAVASKARWAVTTTPSLWFPQGYALPNSTHLMLARTILSWP